MEKFTQEELENLDIAISEMYYLEKIKRIKQQEKWLEDLLRKRNEIDNQILHYQYEHNMSWPFDLNWLKKIFELWFDQWSEYMQQGMQDEKWIEFFIDVKK